MTALEKFPDIKVPWDALENAATDMKTRATSTQGYAQDAHTAWNRLPGAYKHDETQSTVYAALNDMSTPIEDWKDALATAESAISDFVSIGKKLQRESERLSAQLPLLDTMVGLGQGGDNPDLDRQVREFNDRAEKLRSDWSTAQSTAADALDAIKTGTGGSLPLSATLGGPTLPDVSWGTFTAELDEDFGDVNPKALLPSLRGLSTEELRAWADANPEAAELLASNRPDGDFPPGSPEATMAAAMEGDAPLTKSGIHDIRGAWLGLTDKNQEKLLLLYPGLFGSLNGVPLANRATANIITVAGYREKVRRHQADPGPEPDVNDFTAQAFSRPGNDRVRAYSAYGAFQEAHRKWEAARAAQDALDRQIKGFDYAMDHDTQVVMVSLEDGGQIVTMKGQPSSSTTQAATLVPGTSTDLGTLETSMDRLDAIDGDEGPGKVSFYWQGTDLPDKVLDNVSSDYNEQGAPRLAAFDYAVDAEISDKARTTYVSHSAGGSLLGTAEREGLDSSNIVYVAPAGTGHNVGSPQDTQNPDANRYWIQTRDDPIKWSQRLGGGYHGDHVGSVSDPTGQMGAHRLESGFLDPDDPDSIVKGHSEYFTPGSTSANNMQAIIEGGDVSPYIEDKFRYSTPHSYDNYSPLEEHPEEYTHGKLKTVSTESLEK